MTNDRSPQINALGQPIGWPLDTVLPRPRPKAAAMEGRFCRLEPADPAAQAGDLHDAFAADREGRIWTYLPYGPFNNTSAVADWMAATCLGDDPLFFAIRDLQTGRFAGVASYLRIDPGNGVVEVGHINFAPALQRTPAATEAIYLMAEYAIGTLGYRRYEWKCDALNAGSRTAAERLGFRYEGTFRQATHYKGRNRDTAWYALTDGDWPAQRAAFQAWLAPGNFDAEGRQRQRLGEIRKAFSGA